MLRRSNVSLFGNVFLALLYDFSSLRDASRKQDACIWHPCILSSLSESDLQHAPCTSLFLPYCLFAGATFGSTSCQTDPKEIGWAFVLNFWRAAVSCVALATTFESGGSAIAGKLQAWCGKRQAWCGCPTFTVQELQRRSHFSGFRTIHSGVIQFSRDGRRGSSVPWIRHAFRKVTVTTLTGRTIPKEAGRKILVGKEDNDESTSVKNQL